MKTFSTRFLLGLAVLSFCYGVHADEGVRLAKGVTKGGASKTGEALDDPYKYQPGYENAFQIKGDTGIPGLTSIPRMDGSTTAGPLVQLIVARALNIEGELRRLPVGRRLETESLTLTFPFNTPREQLERFQDVQWQHKPQNTHKAYDFLTRQYSSLIIVAREPSPDELNLAALNNVQFDIRPIALDAFVFLTNAKNTVNDLSMEQIRGIYGGQTKKWNEVGGEDKSIYTITRDRNSGSQELMEKLVMGDRPIIDGGQRMTSSMAGTLDAVEDRENSIAYSVYYYERIMNPRETIKPLAVDGVMPTSKTIADGTYSLVEPVYVVIRKDVAPDSASVTLRNWLLSPDGQKLVAQSGYVPIAR